MPRTAALPLSFTQEPLWLLDRLAPGRSTYNVPVAYRLRGPLDAGALRGALADVVSRHEILRTSLHEQAGEGVQRVHEVVDVELPVTEPDGPDPAARHSTASRLAETLARTPFDLAVVPLWRARLYRVDEDDHLLVLVLHHVISDGWSLDVLATDLNAAYRRRLASPDEPPDAPPAIQYADYATWQRQWLTGPGHDEPAGYWRERLADLPLVELPADRPRPARFSYRGATLRHRLGPTPQVGVRALAEAAGVSPYVVYLTAFLLLLHRYTGQDDLVVGTPWANRSRAETEPLVGFFVNMLALRVDLSGDPTVRVALERVDRAVRDALAHGELPFEKVVEAVRPDRDPARSPLFQISFGLLGPTRPLDLPGVRCQTEPLDLDTSRFDLSWNVVEDAGGETADVEVQAEYSTDLFDHGTVEAFAGHYRTLLFGVLADPDAAVSRVPLLTDAERAELLGRWNGPVRAVPRVTIAELFERQVRARPDAVAVVVGGREVTYHELNRRANRLARLLAARGARPGTRVALCLPRELDLVVAVLAVLKAGAGYVPVDAGYPPARMATVLADAAPVVVLTDTALAGRLPADGPPRLLLDTSGEVLAGHSDADLPVTASPDDVAYVIYTSGTTGRPKGVLIEQHSVVGFIAAVTELFELTPADRVLGFASMNFDVSVFEFFSALLNGARLCLARDAERLDTEALQTLVETTGVTVTDLPPPVMALLDPTRFPALRIVFVGGEAFSAELVNRWNPGRRLFNGYGPTECTVTMIVEECPGRWEITPPIGLPMTNHVAHVVDRDLRPVPFGVAGELVIGGAGLTLGYLNAPELTAEKLVADPFGTAPGGRLYRTGDLVKRQPDGKLVFLGRIDQQVKIRGLRIELGEIETVLAGHPSVAQVAVQPWADDAGEKHLVAYVSATPGSRPQRGELREYVAGELPRYMVPEYVVLLDTLPLTVSGKVDRRALPAPDERARGEVGTAEPTTETERVVAGIVADLLRLSRVGVHDNFFELGGNSLQATRAMSRIRDQLGVEVGLADFFQSPTVAHLAGVADRTGAGVPVAGGAAADIRGGDLDDEELLALIERLPADQAARLLDAAEG